MLDLESPVWDTISASPGGTGALAAGLIRRARDGDESAYGELYHQVCHQFTVGEVAYVAVPHLVQIARIGGPRQRVQPLSIVGSVAAARLAHPSSAAPLRDEWRADYLAANEQALRLATEALQETGWDPSDSQELLATVAALHGHRDLAMHLFLQWVPGSYHALCVVRSSRSGRQAPPNRLTSYCSGPRPPRKVSGIIGAVARRPGPPSLVVRRRRTRR